MKTLTQHSPAKPAGAPLIEVAPAVRKQCERTLATARCANEIPERLPEMPAAVNSDGQTELF